jgi:H+-translocating NAD(P) transhydrogenase subunit alpha
VSMILELLASNTTSTVATATTSAQSDLLVNFLIFIMATFLGTALIRQVSKLLHTPLMSLTNAISSISMVAALIVLSESTSTFILILATAGVALASTNIISGYLLTERILRFFKRKPSK